MSEAGGPAPSRVARTVGRLPSRTLNAGELTASPRAFVATVTSRPALNELRSARAGRERDVGEWLLPARGGPPRAGS